MNNQSHILSRWSQHHIAFSRPRPWKWIHCGNGGRKVYSKNEKMRSLWSPKSSWRSTSGHGLLMISSNKASWRWAKSLRKQMACSRTHFQIRTEPAPELEYICSQELLISSHSICSCFSHRCNHHLKINSLTFNLNFQMVLPTCRLSFSYTYLFFLFILLLPYYRIVSSVKFSRSSIILTPNLFSSIH